MSFNLRERLLLKKPSAGDLEGSVWVHCASVGEFNTLKPLIRELKRRFPVVLTYFSPRARSYLESRSELYDLLFPLPLDLPPLIRRFENAVRPRALLVMEREFWFSLIRFTRCRKILLNAYATGSFMERLLVREYSLILARTERDREIFLREGAGRVVVCGNLKLVQDGEPGRVELNLNPGEKLLVAGSTHEGEERIVLDVFRRLRENHRVRLVIAPRHMDRVDRVRELVDAEGFRYTLRSVMGSGWDVLIVDTLGELRSFYCAGDVAFVGGTFVPVGGHNLLEPAFCGRPVIFGPHTRKVRDLEELLVRTGTGFRAEDPDEFFRIAERLLSGGFAPTADLREISRKVRECYLKNVLSELE